MFAAGNVAVWRWPFAGSSFGEHEPLSDPDGDGQAFEFNLRFPGQRADGIAGLNYNYFRDYEPGTGRYIESDPIGLLSGTNTFEYVGARPLNQHDRWGLCWSNADAVAHFYLGLGSSVTVKGIGCDALLSARTSPARDAWKQQVASATEAKAQSMPCGTFERMSMGRKLGMNSGLFWLGGILLKQQADCIVQRTCGSTTGATCGRDGFSFNCLLWSKFDDLFTDPSDFDNSVYGRTPDFWDHWQYGGTPFIVSGYWDETVSGSGSL